MVKIASYPSLESLNEEPKRELTEAKYEYYDKKRTRLMEKMAIANDRGYFREMAKEVKVKDDIAQKVLNNRLLIVQTSQEKDKARLHYAEYQKESQKLLSFCEKMMEKREKEIDSLELEQPKGVPEVRKISKKELDEKFSEIIGQPQYVKPIGKNTLPPHYSQEISRYEPPKPVKQKERED